jgi:hypothetical protein
VPTYFWSCGVASPLERIIYKPIYEWHWKFIIMRPIRRPFTSLLMGSPGHSFMLLTPLPCDFRYAGHYFITTLLYSFFLGCFGVDRFCLGHTGTAVGILLNLGGLGIWWLVDLITGGLMPSDNSNWCTFY